jgi:hypothetical protein
MEIVRLIKGKNHADSSRFPFWIGLYRGRAAGYLDLAIHDPAPRLRRALKEAANVGR